MHVVVETWKARPVWRNSPPAEREAYLDTVVSTVAKLLAGGVELMANGSTALTRDVDYWAVWRFRNRDQVEALARTMERIGWHDRFEPVDVGVVAVATPIRGPFGQTRRCGGAGFFSSNEEDPTPSVRAITKRQIRGNPETQSYGPAPHLRNGRRATE